MGSNTGDKLGPIFSGDARFFPPEDGAGWLGQLRPAGKVPPPATRLPGISRGGGAGRLQRREAELHSQAIAAPAMPAARISASGWVFACRVNSCMPRP